MTDLGVLPEGNAKSHFTRAVGINNAGQIVGTRSVSCDVGCIRAFIWQDGVTTNLGTLPGGDSSQAMAINNDGRDPCRVA